MTYISLLGKLADFQKTKKQSLQSKPQRQGICRVCRDSTTNDSHWSRRREAHFRGIKGSTVSLQVDHTFVHLPDPSSSRFPSDLRSANQIPIITRLATAERYATVFVVRD